MPNRASVLLAMTLLIASTRIREGQETTSCLSTVLHARTVAVLVDPDAGVSIDDPRANQVAQKDVETALLNWGRYEPLLDAQTADLIIVVRKGHGHLVDDTISDPRQNNRPGVINPTDNGAAIGAQHGPQGSPSDASSSGLTSPGSPHPQTEIGDPDDSFRCLSGRRAQIPSTTLPYGDMSQKTASTPTTSRQ